MEVRSALRVWMAGLNVGWGTIRKEPALGAKRLLLPVGYWRTAEFAYAIRQLQLPRGSRILDLGSPKDLATILACRRGHAVVATDILPSAVALSQRYAIAQAVHGEGPGKVWSEVQDGRSLSYADHSFDAAFSISVLEHIPDDGDSMAIRELMRVIKPGGLLVLTVPYDLSYRETFVNRGVYEREQETTEPVFLERHYDEVSLIGRLVDAADGILEDRELWGEGRVRTEQFLHRLGRLEIPFSPLHPLFSVLFLRRIEAGTDGHPMAAFLTLRKHI